MVVRRQSSSRGLPSDVDVDDEDVVRVVLEYLRRRGYVSAMRALETESHARAENLGEDAAFLRELVLDGRWEDAITLIEPLRPGTAVHARACFEIQRQAFLEQLEDKGDGGNATALVKALHKLEAGSSAEEFNELCYCLTLPGVCSHPDYASWTPHLGRLWCFDALRGDAGLLFPGQEIPAEPVPEGQLELLCRQACMHQADQLRQKDPQAVFPSSVVGGILSGVWAPKQRPREASTTSASAGSSAGSAAGNGNGNGRAARGILLTSAGQEQEDGAGGAGVSKSRPLGWMLSCVSGEPWDGRSPVGGQGSGGRGGGPERVAGLGEPPGHTEHQQRYRTADMPEAESPTESNSWMRSTPTLPPPPDSVFPASRQAAPANGNAAAAAAAAASSSSRPTSTSTSSTFSAANLAAHTAEPGNGVIAAKIDGNGGGGEVKSSAEMLVDAAAQVAFTIPNFKPKPAAERLGTLYARGRGGAGDDDDNEERGFEGGATGAPPPKLQQLTPAWARESKISSFSRSTSETESVGDDGGRVRGAGEEDEEVGDYVFLRGKAAAAAVVLVQRSSSNNSGSGSSSSNPTNGAPRQREPEMAELMPNGVRELDNVLPATFGSSTGSANGSAKGIAAAPIYTADSVGGAAAPQEAEAKTTPPVNKKRPVAWEIKLTSPSSECAAVHKEAKGGSGTGGSRGGGGGGGGGGAKDKSTGDGVGGAGGTLSGEAGIALSQRRQQTTGEPQQVSLKADGPNFLDVAAAAAAAAEQQAPRKSLPRLEEASGTPAAAAAAAGVDRTDDSSDGGGSESEAAAAETAKAAAAVAPTLRPPPPAPGIDEDLPGLSAGRDSGRGFTDGDGGGGDDDSSGGDGGGGGGGGGDGGGGAGLREGQEQTRAIEYNATGVALDRVSVEEAPRFVPTILVSGSHPVRSVGFSPDGGLFAVGSNDRTLRVSKTPSEADLASNANVTNGEGGGLQTWKSEEVLRRDNLHRGSIYCLAFSPDSGLLATGSNDKTVRLLKLPGGEAATTITAAAARNPILDDGVTEGGVVLLGHTGTVRDICYPSPHPSSSSAGTSKASERLLSVGAGDFACRVWDVRGGAPAAVAVAAGGGEGGQDEGISPLVVFQGHTDTVFSCSLLPGGNVAVTGGADSFVRVWDARTGDNVRSLVVEGKEVLCVRPWPGDPDRLISTAHSDGCVFMWDMRTGRALSSVLHHTDQTRSLDFSQDGSSLLTASYDGLIGVCDCRPRSAAAAPSGEASSGSDGGGVGAAGAPQVDVSIMAMLRAHGGRVLQAKWNPSGGHGGSGRFSRPAFLTSSTDCTVMLWSLTGATATAGGAAASGARRWCE